MEIDAHHSAGLRHAPDRVVGFGAHKAGDQRPARGMRQNDRLRGQFERIERGLIGAMRNIHGHPDRFHPFHDRYAEIGKSAVAPFEEPAADAIVGVVSELRNALTESEELIYVARRAEVRRILQRDHDADAPRLVGAFNIRRGGDAQHQVRMSGQEAVPSRKEAQSRFVIVRARAEREHVDARASGKRRRRIW